MSAKSIQLCRREMRPKQTGRQNSKLNDPHHHDGDNKTEYLICIRLANVIRQNGSFLWRRPCPSRFYIWSAPCDTSFKARRIEISLLTYLLTYFMGARRNSCKRGEKSTSSLSSLSLPLSLHSSPSLPSTFLLPCPLCSFFFSATKRIH